MWSQVTVMSPQKSETMPKINSQQAMVFPILCLPPGNATSTPPVSWPLKAPKMLLAAGLPKVLFVARKNENFSKVH